MLCFAKSWGDKILMPEVTGFISEQCVHEAEQGRTIG
jgi:hypothetical protein